MLNNFKIVLYCSALAGLLTACGPTPPTVAPNYNQSTDPILTSLLHTFRNACIANAPDFDEHQIRASFKVHTPTLAPEMTFIASGEPGRKCAISVLNYGSNRPEPTVGDLTVLGQALQARVGGKLEPASARLSKIDVKLGLRSFNIFAYTNKKGNLKMTVFK